MAPFFRRVNARIAVPEKTLIDQFIKRAHIVTGDCSYRLPPEFRKFVYAALGGGDSGPNQKAAA